MARGPKALPSRFPTMYRQAPHLSSSKTTICADLVFAVHGACMGSSQPGSGPADARRSWKRTSHPPMPMSGHLTLGWRGKPQLAGWIERSYFRYEAVA
jgi:hypothetical protein